ncbi:LCP family glycopolymer transferase [Demequina gelatinilytica]|uniref:LCP family glycopolymer transferase n=1 Tax=Demequina gelatinilytica TaxID=1638980 RepID=UPI0007821261|nr:LCP family protein [Demequina gelatinilytica]
MTRARHSVRPVRRRLLRGLWGAVAGVTGFVLTYVGTNAVLVQRAFDTHDISSLLGHDPVSTVVADDAPTEEAEPTDFASGEALNILLIGSDERTDPDSGDGDVEGMRGDTTLVLHISKDRERIDVVSIPRDLRTAIPSCRFYDGSTSYARTDKFNAALMIGGRNGDLGEAAACVMTTVAETTGVEFGGHFMMVDFEGFTGMVDAIDGVPMCITEYMYSKDAHLELQAGAQVLHGKDALAFARARKGIGLGGTGTDLARIERQQELLTNTARKVLGLNYLTNAPALTQFIRAGAESLSMDTELGSLKNLIGLAYSLRGFDTKNLHFYTVPWHYPGDGTSDVVVTEPAATETWQAIIADQPITTAEENVTQSPEPSAAPSPTGSATPDASADPTPTATAGPRRETQKEILDACNLPAG